MTSIIRNATEAERKYFGNNRVMERDGFALFGVPDDPPVPPPSNADVVFLAAIHAIPGVAMPSRSNPPLGGRGKPVAQLYEVERLYGPGFKLDVNMALMRAAQPEDLEKSLLKLGLLYRYNRVSEADTMASTW
jgi:hypothetical protein